MFALVDCNNFFVSCERVFAPHLNNKPVLVLSNNDGCVIARSQEVKDLGVGMGEPFFKVRNLCQQHEVAVYSSNYELYGDMSARVMAILASMAPGCEIYSIDEAFLDLSGIPEDQLEPFCTHLRQLILTWTGIPASIGIGPTKVLAKVASVMAKKYTYSHVCNLAPVPLRRHILNGFAVGDIWGIGRNLSYRLEQVGIYTAYDLMKADRNLIRQLLSVIGLQVADELRGISCLGLEDIQPKKQIIASRSFGRPVKKKEELAEAIASHMSRAAEKLRHQNSITGAIQVYLQTNAHNEKGKKLSFARVIDLTEATNYTPDLITQAKQLLEVIYQPGYAYRKAGIMLLDISDPNSFQHNLFKPSAPTIPSLLMRTLDKLNQRFERKAVHFLATRTAQKWSMRRNFSSPRYTTNWTELKTIK